MPSVLEQCTSALQQKRFTEATALADEALAGAAAVARLPLLEVLAQAQAGLQEHTAAAQTWQRAYEQAATPADNARLFERERQDADAFEMLAEIGRDVAAVLRPPIERRRSSATRLRGSAARRLMP